MRGDRLLVPVVFVLSAGALFWRMGEPGGEGPSPTSPAADTLLDVDSMAVATRLAGGATWKTDFSRITVPPEEIVSGGPPKDGIPSIDEPRFQSIGEADSWLNPSDPVMVVEAGGEVRAYPLRILVMHEIVNDRVGGVPVAVTYCPLCNTALVFERTLPGGQVVEFGTTGRLRHSDLIMYDRSTGTWWQQATGEGIVGRHAGDTLAFRSSNTFSWERAREFHPDARVLSRETGYDRDYSRSPYPGYEDRGKQPIQRFVSGATPGPLPPMERVAAVDLDGGWAVPYSVLSERRVVNATVAGRPLTVFWAPGAASPLDEVEVSRGEDVGQVAVFERRIEGEGTLSFRWETDGGGDGGAWVDEETGSRWNLAGRAVSGPLEGREVKDVRHDSPFWFAWVGFRPETELWSVEGGGQ
ncbi:MAG: DUF3179 domain-containing protein [Candidatus Palauibacterales bacterium]|nr:DUF3179 domain-containing protein [Candidatus Palauibacterales bacterium]